MRFLPRAILAGGTGFAVSLLAACGGGGNGLLSGGQASTLQGRLNQISAAVASRNCVGADRGSQALASAVLGLPNTVNVTVRQDLAQGAHTVGVLAMRDCQKTTTTTASKTSSTTTSKTSSTTSTTSSTTSTTPTTTATTATTPTTTATTATTPTTPPTTPTTPSGGGGLGGGGGSGDGGGKGKHG